MLQLFSRTMTHNKKNEAKKLSLEQLMGMAVFFVSASIKNVQAHISALNIITPDDTNKYGYKKLSRILDSRGQRDNRERCGLSYV